jgi:hypothetical protein
MKFCLALAAALSEASEDDNLSEDLFCHVDGPEDYFEYTGLINTLAQRGWVISHESKKGILPHMQWCPHNKTAWPLVLRSNLVTVSLLSCKLIICLRY